jgi:hypothetical protein
MPHTYTSTDYAALLLRLSLGVMYLTHSIVLGCVANLELGHEDG